MKTIRREVVIRDSDLTKIMVKSIKDGLWDRIESEPLTFQGIQHEILVSKLKNPDAIVPKHSTLPNIYEHLLYKEYDLYNKKYLDWHLTMDYPAGQIYVQSRLDRIREPLVCAWFEKDIL